MAQTQSYQTPNTYQQTQQGQDLQQAQQAQQYSSATTNGQQQQFGATQTPNTYQSQQNGAAANRHLDQSWSQGASSHELELRRQQQLQQQQQMQQGAAPTSRSASDMQATQQQFAERDRLAQQQAQSLINQQRQFNDNTTRYQNMAAHDLQWANQQRQFNQNMGTPLVGNPNIQGQMSTNMPPQQQGWGQQQAQWRPPVQWQQQAAFNSPANYGYGGYGMQQGGYGGYGMPMQGGYGMPYGMQSGYGGGYGMPMQGGYSPYQSPGFSPYAQPPAFWR